jgi:AraC-like DNA-binding protein
VREYLQDHFHENVTLARLSQIANLSPYHLNRVFCAEVGIPPHQYQAQVRIARAKLMLMNGVPVAQVAIDTGFADQSHFGRYFKRYMQVSPRRYLWHDKSARSF